MSRPSTAVRCGLWLLCAALLLTRMSGEHLHLCFDGADPPISMHTDGSEFDVLDEQSGHCPADVKVRLSADALVKKSVMALDVSAAMVRAFVLVLVADTHPPKFSHFRTPSPLPSAAFFLRPPLRGPPR